MLVSVIQTDRATWSKNKKTKGTRGKTKSENLDKAFDKKTKKN